MPCWKRSSAALAMASRVGGGGGGKGVSRHGQGQRKGTCGGERKKGVQKLLAKTP